MHAMRYILAILLFLFGKTVYDIQPVAKLFREGATITHQPRVIDRHGTPLSIRYQNRWNCDDLVPLYAAPPLLLQAFVTAEDKTFWQHHGVDWRAKGAALKQNISSRRIVRGASTITEQVVRILVDRPRTLWSKWLEMWEAHLLENGASKHEILEFYINQVPFASHRRGVTQASHYFFNRDLSTLTPKEILALVVMVRAPSSTNAHNPSTRLEQGITRLAQSLSLTLSDAPLSLERETNLMIEAPHFIRYCREKTSGQRLLRTTLDGRLQYHVQRLLRRRIQALAPKNVNHASVIVMDHTTGEILVWAVADQNPDTPQHIDAVRTLRQPGSALKPFLYAAALEKGWTVATKIEDAPLSGTVGCGLHRFRNYSDTYYGHVSVREALGNSLNIPAIKTINFVGVSSFLDILKKLGFHHLTRASSVYDEGLALGNGEVTLLELVEAFAVLANKGLTQPHKIFLEDKSIPQRIFKPETTSLISHVLSDPWARRLEFGINSVMNLPIQTATKTGTSTDYRDAWTVGYNHRYVVGIWMGNLDHAPMEKVTGSTGPAIVLRAIFALLNQQTQSRKLYMSPSLTSREIDNRVEYFDPEATSVEHDAGAKKPSFVQPTHNLRLAYDPRIPRDKQFFEFRLDGVTEGETVEWRINDTVFKETKSPQCLWPVEQGTYHLSAVIKGQDGTNYAVERVTFYVR